MVEVGVKKEFTNEQKAALIFLMLDEKGAANLFDHMTDEEIKKIGNTMLEMNEISVDELNGVINEFYEDLGISVGYFSGKRVFERLVDKTLSPERKSRILSVEDVKGGKGSIHNPLEGLLDDVDPNDIFHLVRKEQTQTIAVVLTLLKPTQSREIIQKFEKQEQVDILYRMAVLSRIPEDMIRAIAENFKRKIETGSDSEFDKKDVHVPGADLVLKYLKTQEWSKAEEIITQIEVESPEIAMVLRKNYFTFDDLLRADNNGIRNLLKNVEIATLSVALKGLEENVQDLFFRNMSSRAAAILKEDIQMMPDQKKEDKQAAIDIILDEAKKLVSDGQMLITSSGDE